MASHLEEEDKGVVEGCYCGNILKTEFNETYFCDGCKKNFHPRCLMITSPCSLDGDYFFNFKCRHCSENGMEVLSRMEMQWKDVVKLSLYNLQSSTRGELGYIKYNDICEYVGANWNILFGRNRRKTNSLNGTIAGTLSTNKEDFVNGSNEIMRSGYWKLRDNRPPVVCRNKQRRQPRARQSAEAKITAAKDQSDPVRVEGLRARRPGSSYMSAVALKARQREDPEPKDMRKRGRGSGMDFDSDVPEKVSRTMKTETQDSSAASTSYNSPLSCFGNEDSLHSFKSEPSLSPFPQEDRPPVYLLDGEEEYQDQEGSLSDPEFADMRNEYPGSPPDLTGRDSMMGFMGSMEGMSSQGKNCDSDLEALAKLLQVVKAEHCNFDDLLNLGMTGAKTVPKSMSAESQHSQDKHLANSEAGLRPGDRNQDNSIGGVEGEEKEGEEETGESSQGSAATSTESRESASQEQPKAAIEEPTQPRTRSLSEYEERELVAGLDSKAPKEPLTPKEAQIRTMLKINMMKRAQGKQPFNLTETLARLTGATPASEQDSSNIQTRRDPNLFNTPQNMTDLQEKQLLLDKFMNLTAQYNQRRTFQQMVTGLTDLELKHTTSPYTNRTLTPFIFRIEDIVTPKMKLLQEIQAYPHRFDPTWQPPPRPTVDFCYVRPEHIPAVNSLAREHFWPGIDFSDAILWPDYTCVVLYRKLVVAFAFMIPGKRVTEAYITFMFTHPEWRRSKIAMLMMYHLTQTAGDKDITLHVSANNDAMMLYQRYGFKTEELIYNFYDKYLPFESPLSKHAFYMRYQRQM